MSVSRWFTSRLRVRYAETDQMGVVYHANYLTWFEIGRTEMIRELGLPYRDLENRGLLLPVIDLDMNFKLPAQYDDEVLIHTRIDQYSNIRMGFEVRIERIGGGGHVQLLVAGRTRHVWLNREWKPVRIDKAAPDLYEIIAKNCNADPGENS